MNNYLLSIIVPSYNSVRFIESYKAKFDGVFNIKNVCVIFVDDGSNDDTYNELVKFCSNYNNFYVFHKDNHGHGSAINYGIQNASSTYIKCLDADDWLSFDNFKQILDILKLDKYDAVFTDNIFHYLQSKEQKLVYTFNIKGGEVRFHDLLKANLNYHSVIFKRDIFIKNNILLSENCFYEDFEYFLIPLTYCKDIYYCKTVFYNYAIGIEGQSVSKQAKVKNLNSYDIVSNKLISFYHQNLNKSTNNYMTDVYRKYLIIFLSAYLDVIYYCLRNKVNYDFYNLSKNFCLYIKDKRIFYKFIFFNKFKNIKKYLCLKKRAEKSINSTSNA